MKEKIRIFYLFSVLAVVQSPLWASESSNGIHSGRFTLSPGLALNVQQDDNLFEASDNELDVLLTEVVPSVGMQFKGVLTDLELEYQLFDGSYDDSPLDDYTDHRLQGSLGYQLTRRSRLDLNGHYFREHEQRSATRFDFIPDSEPDEYDESNLQLTYTLGRKKSKGRLEAHVGAFDQEYTNNRTQTLDDDRKSLFYGLTFFLRVNPRSNLFVEYLHSEIDYINDPVAVEGSFDSLDSDRDRIFGGYSWQISGKTQGAIKLGYGQRVFSDSDREDFSGLSWQIKASWQATKRSVLRLETSQEDKESGQGTSGGFIDEQLYGIEWERRWGNKLTSKVFAEYVIEDYIDFIQDRKDRLSLVGFRMDYRLIKWLNLGLSIDYSENDSSIEGFDYTRNRYTIHLKSSF